LPNIEAKYPVSGGKCLTSHALDGMSTFDFVVVLAGFLGWLWVVRECMDACEKKTQSPVVVSY